MSDKIINFNKSVQPTEIKKGDFDFEYWSKLAKQDPEAFEVAREAEINKHISSLADKTAQERMRSLQWRIEMERKRSSSPLNAASRIYDMMWESVGRNIKVLDELAELIQQNVNPGSKRNSEKTSAPAKKDNTVLAFKRKEMEVATAD